jgi:CelD/BcsL family acetyltransferase involved in cellulose biosynthesis
MYAPLASGLRIDWRPLAALDHVKDEWRALSARALEPNVFYDPAFALAAAPVFGREVGAGLIWLGARLVGFFPATVTRRRYGLRRPVLIGWTHPYAPLGTPLVAAEVAQETIAAWLDHLADNADMPDLMLLPMVPQNGPFATALNSVLRTRQHALFGSHQRALLAPGMQRSDYLERAVGGRTRKEWRRQRRRLEDKGAVSVASTSDNAATAALDDFLALEAGGWKGRAGTAARDDAKLSDFMRGAVASLADKAGIHRLMLGDRAIAAAITLRSREYGWFWKIAYDEAWAQFSPGVLLALELTEKLLRDDGLAHVDSCATANHPMIDRLWDERLTLADHFVGIRPTRGFFFWRQLEALRRAGITTAKTLLGRR